MKKYFLLLGLAAALLYAPDANSQSAGTNADTPGRIYFFRSTGFSGSGVKFKTFIDGELACVIKNNRYSAHEVPAGNHSCSVQIGGRESKSKAEKFELSIEPGKNYYVKVVLKGGALINDVFCEEITENTGKQLLETLKEQTDCKVGKNQE